MQMWAILEQLRDHATTIVGLVTALTLMYSWFRKPMKQLIAREQQQEEDLAILTWAFLQNAHDNYTRRKDEITYPQATSRTFLLCLKRRQKGGEANDEAESIRPVQQTNCFLVTIAVTVISLLAMVLCFFRSDTEALVSTVRTYINYATIVFAAYSGNSVFEKWLTQGKSNDTPGDTEEK